MSNYESLREAGENYLEAILNLENEKGEARSIDVANHIGVSRPSVNKAMGVLKEMGMVEQEPYGALKLTALGRGKAEEIYHRHLMLRKFLTNVLGVDPIVANEDACRIEHIVSEETMEKIAAYMSEK